MESIASCTIDGVTISPLKIMEDDRGAVLHMLRSDSGQFTNFGEIYFSESKPGIIKGWKRHKKMTQIFAVPRGEIKLVIIDLRKGSISYKHSQEIHLGRPNNYYLVRIPPMLWYGFKNTGSVDSLITNCTDMPHSYNECETLPLDTKLITYMW